MRIFIGILLTFFTVILSAQSSTKFVNAPTLNLRESANTNSQVVQKLTKGQEVEVIEFVGDWALVSIEGITGYVATKYLSDSQATSTAKNKNESKVLICNSQSAYAYHSHECHGLNRCKASISSVSESQARSSGYRPCKICY